MRRLARKIATLLVAVLLATVLTPSFGWEASGQDSHDQSTMAITDTCGVQDHHDDKQCENDNLHHHGCAGHMFSHLVAHFSDAAIFIPPELISGFIPGLDAADLPGFSERLDRPPLAPILA